MSAVEFPKIYLTMDNCFAIKRWVKPKDWMRMIHEIGGINCVQASTDNEIDPLFCSKQYRNAWVSEVKEYGAKYDMKVVSFFSGYATYRTVGLAGAENSTRDILRKTYFNEIVDTAAELGAQVGNTLGAFSLPVLNSPQEFEKHRGYLKENLVMMAQYAASKNVPFSYEQMYTPIQGFWKIDECKDWLREIYRDAGAPMYVTIDSAHQVGQKYYLKPEDLHTVSSNLPETVEKMIRDHADEPSIINEMKKFDYYFSEQRDGDVFSWFEELGAYSPLVHLQQTDGTYSSHKPFTKQYNANGIIDPEKVLKSIAKSYRNLDASMPPPAKEIYLAFELFFGITDSQQSIVNQLRESVEFWRKAIPQDGLRIDELVDVG